MVGHRKPIPTVEKILGQLRHEIEAGCFEDLGVRPDWQKFLTEGQRERPPSEADEDGSSGTDE